MRRDKHSDSNVYTNVGILYQFLLRHCLRKQNNEERKNLSDLKGMEEKEISHIPPCNKQAGRFFKGSLSDGLYNEMLIFSVIMLKFLSPLEEVFPVALPTYLLSLIFFSYLTTRYMLMCQYFLFFSLLNA